MHTQCSWHSQLTALWVSFGTVNYKEVVAAQNHRLWTLSHSHNKCLFFSDTICLFKSSVATKLIWMYCLPPDMHPFLQGCACACECVFVSRRLRSAVSRRSFPSGEAAQALSLVRQAMQRKHKVHTPPSCCLHHTLHRKARLSCHCSASCCQHHPAFQVLHFHVL